MAVSINMSESAQLQNKCNCEKRNIEVKIAQRRGSEVTGSTFETDKLNIHRSTQYYLVNKVKIP